MITSFRSILSMFFCYVSCVFDDIGGFKWTITGDAVAQQTVNRVGLIVVVL